MHGFPASVLVANETVLFRIGALLTPIPPPLDFGAVALNDGPFLEVPARSAGLSGVPEIMRLGNWRAWLGIQLGG